MAGKIMIVGDDTAAMRLVANRLAAGNFEVRLIDSPTEAVAVAREDDIDVALLNFKDLMADGLQLVRSLKRNRRWIEVITLSAPSGLRLSIESMKLGAFADVLMPFDLEELLAKIVEAWERKKAKSQSFFRRLENLAVSVSFAEAGDFDTAQQIMKKSQNLTERFHKEEER